MTVLQMRSQMWLQFVYLEIDILYCSWGDICKIPTFMVTFSTVVITDMQMKILIDFETNSFRGKSGIYFETV